jgi:hypothetical protein
MVSLRGHGRNGLAKKRSTHGQDPAWSDGTFGGLAAAARSGGALADGHDSNSTLA